MVGRVDRFCCQNSPLNRTRIDRPPSTKATPNRYRPFIGEHYAAQAAKLGDDEAELRGLIEEFRADELAHRDTGLAEGAEEMAGYRPFTDAIKAGTRLAIWLSERV